MRKLRIYLDTSVIGYLDQHDDPELMGVKAVTALEGFNDVLIYTPSILLGGEIDDT